MLYQLLSQHMQNASLLSEILSGNLRNVLRANYIIVNENKQVSYNKKAHNVLDCEM